MQSDSALATDSAHFSKNDVISSIQKYYSALELGLELELGLGLGLQNYVFGQSYIRARVIDP